MRVYLCVCVCVCVYLCACVCCGSSHNAALCQLKLCTLSALLQPQRVCVCVCDTTFQACSESVWPIRSNSVLEQILSSKWGKVYSSMSDRPKIQRVSHMARVGQNRIYTPCMTVTLVISLPKTPYLHRIYMYYI